MVMSQKLPVQHPARECIRFVLDCYKIIEIMDSFYCTLQDMCNHFSCNDVLLQLLE